MTGADCCGYDPCPCRGVNFISSYQGMINYCVDGKRVRLDSRVSMVVTPSATLTQVAALEAHLVSSYRDYLNWHKRRFDGASSSPEPFQWTLPLQQATKERTL